jgi:hypothetical protein
MSLPEASLAVSSGVAAAGLQAIGFAVIGTAIVRREVRPNSCSWLIWSVVAALAAAGSWQAGATWPLAGAAMNALGCILVLLLSLRLGRFAANPVDLTCLAAATAGIGAWLITSDPVAGLVLFLVADACGAVPTMRNVVIDPSLESARGWALLALAGAAAVLSVESQHWAWSWAGFGRWGGAVYVAAVNCMVAVSIILARMLRAVPSPSFSARSSG